MPKRMTAAWKKVAVLASRLLAAQLAVYPRSRQPIYFSTPFTMWRVVVQYTCRDGMWQWVCTAYRKRNERMDIPL